MLAYLIDEQAPAGGQASLDVVPVMPAPDNQGVWAQVAYEAAQELEPERWIPARRAGRKPPARGAGMSAPSTTRRAAVVSNAYSNVDCGVTTTGVTMAQTTTVRVHQHTRQAIAELSAQRGTTAADLLEELVARERDNALLDAMNAHFADLTDDERRALAEEREAWEGTLLDGLTQSP